MKIGLDPQFSIRPGKEARVESMNIAAGLRLFPADRRLLAACYSMPSTVTLNQDAVNPVRELTRVAGACHCRNVRFTLEWPADVPEIPVRKCGCSFCQKHAAAWTSHPSAKLAVEVDDPSLVSRYNFGTRTADFFCCAVCGVVPFVLSKIRGRQYAVVNVNTLEDIGRFSFSSSETDFDGENTESRLQRRQQNWIPGVSLNENSSGSNRNSRDFSVND